MGNTATTDTKQPETAEDYIKLTEDYAGSQRVTSNAPSHRGTQEPTAEEVQGQVNELMKQVTVDEKGKFVYPDNTPMHLKLLVAGEKKFRDTQRSYTKQQQSTKELEAKNGLLQEKLVEAVKMDIPKEEAERLEQLKFTDPDKWFDEMTALNSAPMTKYDDAMSDVGRKAGEKFEMERRISVLEEFNSTRKTPLTQEMLANDIPPRITAQLADGSLSFEDYLSKVDIYLSKGRVVKNENAPDDTDLSTASGGTDKGDGSSETIQTENVALDYKNLTL